MKRNNLTLLFCIMLIMLISSCGSSQSDNTEVSDSGKLESSTENQSEVKNTTESTPEQKVEAIRKKFQEIESNINTYKAKKGHYMNPDPELYYDQANYTTFTSGNEMVKLVEEAGEEGYSSIINYYFDKGKLIFIFSQYWFMDDLYQEDRIYLDNEKIFKALIKDKEPEDETTKLSTINNSDNQSFIKNPEDYSLSVMNNFQNALKDSKDAK